MIYYKHKISRDIFAYESKEEMQAWGSPDLIEMTRDEVEVHTKNTTPSSVSAAQQKEAEERAWRDAELSYADVELSKVQDSDPSATGSVGDWRQYRKELRAWPKHKDFPNKGARPKAPTEE